MKHLIVFSGTLLFLVASIAPEYIYLAGQESNTRYAWVNSSLRMRSEASVKGKVVGAISSGGAVKLIGEKEKEETIAGREGKWSKVLWNGKTGWVFGGFLCKHPYGTIKDLFYKANMGIQTPPGTISKEANSFPKPDMIGGKTCASGNFDKYEIKSDRVDLYVSLSEADVEWGKAGEEERCVNGMTTYYKCILEIKHIQYAFNKPGYSVHPECKVIREVKDKN